ncbi:MAG TPA: DNA alkylation repair protein, partial [Acidimicrobiales bacterium]|nr:DNA alkylation repair protein [Acidimicrobiales bacterium]
MAITPTPGHHARQADDIGEQLRSLGVPERAAAEKRYLKSSLRHLGTAVPEVRRVARKAAGTIGSHCELVTLARALWEAPVHERRLCAVFLLEARVDLIGPGDLPLIEEFVRGAKTWALVDDLAGALLGELVVAHPEVAEAFDAWATDADFWI